VFGSCAYRVLDAPIFDIYADTMTQRRIVEARIIPHVFHRDGHPIKYMRRAWLSACKRAATVTHPNGIKEVVRAHLLGRLPHDSRRTAVRNLVRAGVPERVAMQLTGHKARSVFDRYNIVNERDLRDGVSKLAALHAVRSGRGKAAGFDPESAESLSLRSTWTV